MLRWAVKKGVHIRQLFATELLVDDKFREKLLVSSGSSVRSKIVPWSILRIENGFIVDIARWCSNITEMSFNVKKFPT